MQEQAEQHCDIRFPVLQLVLLSTRIVTASVATCRARSRACWPMLPSLCRKIDGNNFAHCASGSQNYGEASGKCLGIDEPECVHVYVHVFVSNDNSKQIKSNAYEHMVTHNITSQENQSKSKHRRAMQGTSEIKSKQIKANQSTSNQISVKP